jgi:hypothetical protein
MMYYRRLLLILALLLFLLSSASAVTFTGKVYEGAIGDTSIPSAGVTVELYGSNSYGVQGTFISSGVTNRSGSYSLEGPDTWEFNTILLEVPTGATTVGAQSSSGSVLSPSWIMVPFSVVRGNLFITGNDFWIERAVTCPAGCECLSVPAAEEKYLTYERCSGTICGYEIPTVPKYCMRPVTITPSGPTDDTPCEDGDLCTVNDVYHSGICTSGQTLVCDDQNPTTIDTCDPTQGCVYFPSATADGAPCDDGNACTISDRYLNGSCLGDPLFCDDRNPETVDTCQQQYGCVFEFTQENAVYSTPLPNTSFATQAPTWEAPVSTQGETEEVQSVTEKPRDFVSTLISFIFSLFSFGKNPEPSVHPDNAPVAKDKVVSCADAGGIVCPGVGCQFIKTDPQNCGLCGNVCPTHPYANATCLDGVCSFTCIKDYGDCNQYAADGCEMNLVADQNHCGACGHYCTTDRICINKECRCTGGRTDCNGVCIDLSQNSQHCGSCGSTCRFDQICENGVCRCHYGTKECAGQCIDPLTDPRIECSGKCIDPTTDMLNCGGCGKVCTAMCSGGKCQGGCFPADTLVATSDSFKPISLVQRGDVIPGYDLNMKEVINRTITETLLHENQPVLQLEFAKDTIVCTPSQPFFTGTWTPASDLRAGDTVLCRDGHWEVLLTDPYPVGERDVFNLHGSPSEEYYASYYVGRSQLLVHNAKR